MLFVFGETYSAYKLLLVFIFFIGIACFIVAFVVVIVVGDYKMKFAQKCAQQNTQILRRVIMLSERSRTKVNINKICS